MTEVDAAAVCLICTCFFFSFVISSFFVLFCFLAVLYVDLMDFVNIHPSLPLLDKSTPTGRSFPHHAFPIFVGCFMIL